MITLKKQYRRWIDHHYPTFETAWHQCQRGTEHMHSVFPELRIAKGWCCGIEHWWCVDPDGTVVDPTFRQFNTLGPASYREFKPGDRVRVGRCMNCGCDIYKEVQELEGDRECICSEECSEDYANYLNAEISSYRKKGPG